MSDVMTFPATFEEFAKSYKIVDSKQVYTNGTELIPIFRVEQWLEHKSTLNLTENSKEIKKALECCLKTPFCTEKMDCLYKGTDDCVKFDAIDLINRLQTENERLKKENEILSINSDTAFQDGLNEAQSLYAEQVKAEIISEAIKEFAERLKEKQQDFIGEEYFYKFIYLIEIDNLVKEMVGEEE